ncbi:MAG: hypothetical protein COB08_004550 [Rhodobacteraceae bacterium]|nr:hypothetical protein [Paracoccaceae bacterium]
MKIWIGLAKNYYGNNRSYFYSGADADSYALGFCKQRWRDDLGAMPEAWRDAYEKLTAEPSYMDWLHMGFLGISGHPDLLAAREELKHIVTAGYPTCVDHAADMIVNLGGEQLEYEE